METDAFLKACLSTRDVKPSKSAPFGLTWANWNRFAQLTGRVDFGCNFDVKTNKCMEGSETGCMQ